MIVDSSGLIVTNNHVIRGARTFVWFWRTSASWRPKLMLADELSDLAMLKIEVGDEVLAALPFGDSDNLEVGDQVWRLASPLVLARR